MNKKLTWQDQPTVAGYYYLRVRNSQSVLIVEAFFSGNHMFWRDINRPEVLNLVRVADGKWAGPIRELPE